MNVEYSGKIKFLNYCKKNIKYLYTDIGISCAFTVLSSTRPVLSIGNSAWYVLLWYIISLTLLLTVNWYNTNSNIKNKIERKRLKKYNYRKNLTSEKKKRIISYKKEQIEWGGFTFMGIKIVVSLAFLLILYPISLILQFVNYSNYMLNQKEFFVSIFMGSFVTTIFTTYYSLIVNEVRKQKGFKNKLNALFIYQSDTSLFKRIVVNILLYLIFIYALVYSLFGFSIIAPLFMGLLYVCTLLIPVNDKIS